MSDPGNEPNAAPGDDDIAAAEFAIGLMEPAEAESFAARLTAEPALAALVAKWQARLLDLDLTAAPVPAREALWSRIVAGIDVAAPSRGATADRRRLSGDGRRRVERPPLQRRLSAWRAAALVATAAALIIAVVAARLVLAPPEPTLLAVLIGPDGRAGAVVQVFPDGHTALVSLADVEVPAGRTLEVWTKWSEERGPVSVGLLARAASAVLATQGLPATRPDQLFEITLEPAGGSPTGRPTGPVLFKGTATPTL